MDILKIYTNPDTVFTRGSLAQLYPRTTPKQLTNALTYAVKAGKLLKLRRGVYAKSPYNPQELAVKLYPPSYISLETILRNHGVIFQTSGTIQCVSYLTRSLTVDGHLIEYRKMRDHILTSQSGLISLGSVTAAGPERALLDAVFIFHDYHFDNLRPINWDIVHTLLPIYNSKVLTSRAGKLEKEAANE